MVGSILLLRLITALTSDPNRTQNFSPLWFVLWVISVLAMTAFVILVMALGLKKRLLNKPRPLANLITIGTAGVVGNVTVGLLAMAWGLDSESLWVVRIGGGFIGSAFMFFVINSLRSSLIARNESIRKLVQTERALLGYRESAKQIIADEIDSLKLKTKEYLLPAIEKIQTLIEDRAGQNAEIVDELKLLISQDVRPLSKTILEEAATLANPTSNQHQRATSRIAINAKYNLKRSMRPLIGLPFFAALFPMVQFLVIDHRSAFRGLLGGVATGLTLLILKALLPKSLEVTVASGTTLQLLLSTISIVPAWWIMYQEYGNTEAVLWATTILWLMVLLSAFLLAYSKGVELNAERYAITLTQKTQELEKEIALFEQKLALEKRAWSRVIHGEVQSALSAALARLQINENLEPYQLEMVKQDLHRAKQNLINPPKQNSTFNQAFAEIVLTWKSICQIQADISARAQRAIDQNEDTRTVTNEIIKEAVSNAVRHGQAKQVNIKLDRIKDDILEIEISNDGYKPQRDKAPGLGSQMLNELTLSWCLENKNNKTTLTAEVPISKN